MRDPPFSRMDLISCRNVLIYIEPEPQRRALALFHFALREGGRLFLGSAETIGRADDLFETISKKWRIYRRIGPTRHNIVDFPLLGGHQTNGIGSTHCRRTKLRYASPRQPGGCCWTATLLPRC